MKHPYVSPKCPFLLHGADYSPEQWLDRPEVLAQDIELMKESHSNVMHVGIFSWAKLEPSEGVFEFGWLDDVLDRFAKNGIYTILATPSGARPAWLSYKYPEVLRVESDRQRIAHGNRHNHCYTSPVFRDKVAIINGKLAERYAKHPTLALWHLSNEYSGECYCELCIGAFRKWLEQRYDGSLDKLNSAWWSHFWSHTFTDFSQVVPPGPWPHFDGSMHGLVLDWRRFVTHQSVDFMRHEIASVRRFTPDIPVTTNLMGTYPGLDYWKYAPHLDLVSWDSYPNWHEPKDPPSKLDDADHGSFVAFLHDLNRSLKGGRPFMLMESVPSATNWRKVAKLKRPNMHLLSSLQAVAHGSDSVDYFQWRKGRGSSEKFHGAVVDHSHRNDTRVFGDVRSVGIALEKLRDVAGTALPAEVALVHDWENRWALEIIQGFHNERWLRDPERVCHQHYIPYWRAGVPVDVIDMDQDFSKYRVLVAPMLYMLKPGVAERIRAFVEAGGVFVTTYLTGWVDESDLVFDGGAPGPLKDVLGVRVEETDCIYGSESNAFSLDGKNPLALAGTYESKHYCDLLHAEGAEVLATYERDFYAGRPALTRHQLGNGEAYYLATESKQFVDAFHQRLVDTLALRRPVARPLPAGISVCARTDGEREYLFVMNFVGEPQSVTIERGGVDLLSGDAVGECVELAPFGVAVVERPRNA